MASDVPFAGVAVVHANDAAAGATDDPLDFDHHRSGGHPNDAFHGAGAMQQPVAFFGQPLLSAAPPPLPALPRASVQLAAMTAHAPPPPVARVSVAPTISSLPSPTRVPRPSAQQQALAARRSMAAGTERPPIHVSVPAFSAERASLSSSNGGSPASGGDNDASRNAAAPASPAAMAPRASLAVTRSGRPASTTTRGWLASLMAPPQAPASKATKKLVEQRLSSVVGAANAGAAVLPPAALAAAARRAERARAALERKSSGATPIAEADGDGDDAEDEAPDADVLERALTNSDLPAATNGTGAVAVPISGSRAVAPRPSSVASAPRPSAAPPIGVDAAAAAYAGGDDGNSANGLEAARAAFLRSPSLGDGHQVPVGLRANGAAASTDVDDETCADDEAVAIAMAEAEADALPTDSAETSGAAKTFASTLTRGANGYTNGMTGGNSMSQRKTHPHALLRAHTSRLSSAAAAEKAKAAQETAMRKAFLIRLMKALHQFGAPTHHTEDACSLAAEALDIPAHFAVVPTCCWVSFGDQYDPKSRHALEEGRLRASHGDSSSAPPTPGTTSSAAMKLYSASHARNKFYEFGIGGGTQSGGADRMHNETVIVKAGQDLHCEKLYLVDELALLVGEKAIELDEAESRLNDILLMPNRYPVWLQVASFTLASTGCAIMFYGGGWWDALFSAVFGCLVGVACWFSGSHAAFGRLLSVVMAGVISFLTNIILYHFTVPNGHEACYFDILLSSIVWLLSGMSITTGVVELASGSLVSGATRVFNAIVNTLMLGFGMAIGTSAAWWIPEQYDSPACVSWLDQQHVSLNIPFFFAIVIPFNLLMAAHPRQWIGMTVSAGVGTIVYTVLVQLTTLASSAITVLSAMGVGLMGGLHSRLTDHPPLINILSGVQVLVPGGLGARGAARSMSGGDTGAGIGFGASMLVVGLQIAVGLFVAKAVIPFRAHQKRFSLL